MRCSDLPKIYPLLLILLLTAACSTTRSQTLYTVVLGNQNHVVGSSTLESGLFVSHDQGESWEQLGPRNLKAYDMDAVISERGRVLYIAAGNGVHRSLDSGKTWKILTDWRITEVLDIAVDQENPGYLYAATAFGLWQSVDSGESWKRAGDSLGHRYIYRVELPSHTYPRRLYVYTDQRQSPSHEFFMRDGALVEVDADDLRAVPPVNSYDSCLWSDAYAVVGLNPGTRSLMTETVYADSAQVYRQSFPSSGFEMTCRDLFVPLGDPLPSPVHALVGIRDRWPYRLIAGTFGDGLFTLEKEGWVETGLPGAQVWSIRAFYYPMEANR